MALLFEAMSQKVEKLKDPIIESRYKISLITKY